MICSIPLYCTISDGTRIGVDHQVVRCEVHVSDEDSKWINYSCKMTLNEMKVNDMSTSGEWREYKACRSYLGELQLRT